MFISIYFILLLECVVNILPHHTGPSLRPRTLSLVHPGWCAQRELCAMGGCGGPWGAVGGCGGLLRHFLLLCFAFKMSTTWLAAFMLRQAKGVFTAGVGGEGSGCPRTGVTPSPMSTDRRLCVWTARQVWPEAWGGSPPAQRKVKGKLCW